MIAPAFCQVRLRRFLRTTGKKRDQVFGVASGPCPNPVFSRASFSRACYCGADRGFLSRAAAGPIRGDLVYISSHGGHIAPHVRSSTSTVTVAIGETTPADIYTYIYIFSADECRDGVPSRGHASCLFLPRAASRVCATWPKHPWARNAQKTRVCVDVVKTEAPFNLLVV